MSTDSDPAAPSAELMAPPDSIRVPDFLSPTAIAARLAEVRSAQPVTAIAAAHQYREAMTDIFLRALERGVEDPTGDFAKNGMLFNYGVYFLAKWRERRAGPLVLRWFSLPGELALELGGDTVARDGARFLASVCEEDAAGIKRLIENRDASPVCRGQGIRALAVRVAWGEASVQETELYLAFLAREGLERSRNQVWADLAAICAILDCEPALPELRRAVTDGLIEPQLVASDEVRALIPKGALLRRFTETSPRIEDIISETRWWAGFHTANSSGPDPGQPPVAAARVGRNDACPCGSGKKFKKCCGAS